MQVEFSMGCALVATSLTYALAVRINFLLQESGLRGGSIEEDVVRLFFCQRRLR